jgi:hypothetical protein
MSEKLLTLSEKIMEINQANLAVARIAALGLWNSFLKNHTDVEADSLREDLLLQVNAALLGRGDSRAQEGATLLPPPQGDTEALARFGAIQTAVTEIVNHLMRYTHATLESYIAEADGSDLIVPKPYVMVNNTITELQSLKRTGGKRE